MAGRPGPGSGAARKMTAWLDPARPRAWIPFLLLPTALLLALHGYVLRFPFISDDYVFICGTWAGSLRNLFGAFHTVQNYFRPLGRELYFGALSLVAGNHPLAFHLINFAVLLATVALVMALGTRLAGPRAKQRQQSTGHGGRQ